MEIGNFFVMEGHHDVSPANQSARRIVHRLALAARGRLRLKHLKLPT
jgi:hypothetical protein